MRRRGLPPLVRTLAAAAARHPRRAVAATVLVAGIGLAFWAAAPGVSILFRPRVGPPDTLRATGIAFPAATPVPRTTYLQRAVEQKPPAVREMERLADRYNVTHSLARLIHAAAVEMGVDPELAFRLVRVESVFDADAIGPGGALGLCQLMPGTARDIDPAMTSRKQILEPRTNLRLGLTNLRAMIERYDGDVRLGVIAYNRGEVAVDRALRRGRDPENGYGQRVLGPRHHGGKPYAGPGLLRREQAGSTTGATPAP